MATLPVQALTVYEADDVTPLFTLSTDPAANNPYLKPFESYPEQEIDFAKGAASIGQMNVQAVDVPTDPTDQATGFLTDLMADANGYSQVNGRRAVATEDRGSGAETVLDGVVKSVRLLDSFVTYEFELRDIRERERKTKAFVTTDTPTVLPRGVLNGYGTLLTGGIRWPVPPTAPLTGFYRADGSARGEVEFDVAADRAELVLTDPMREALTTYAPLDAEPETLIYDRWQLLWRDTASGGAYSTITQVAHRHASLPGGGGRLPYSEGGGVIGGLRINNVVSGDTLPSNGQEIDIIVQYVGPVTEDWPLHLQDLTVGELLRNGYRGDYSEEDPRIRYDESALLDLDTPVRAIIKKPADELRAWAEKHAYPVVHAAPTLNESGEISPVTYLLPDATVTPVVLNDSNCRPAGGGWSHGTEDAVNLVTVKYKRDYRISLFSSSELALSDQIRSRDIEHEFRLQESIDLLGEQPLEIASDLLRALGGIDGGPLFGDVIDEQGAQVARRVSRMATDRFALGGQYFALEISRDDSDAESLRVGSWTTVGVSWMPDYLLGTRGLSRLAQVVGRRNLDASWAVLTLIDAGSANAPVTAPTLGTVTVDDAGVVSIPVTALGSGAEARIDYALNATEPAADSGLWRFLDRVDSVPSTVTTPPIPPGDTAWVRSRGEAVGRRPSAYTTAVSVTAPSTPRVYEVELEVDDTTGVGTVRWSPNSACDGVRVYYEVHDLDTVPTYSDSTDADSADGELVVPDVRAIGGLRLSVRVEPYPTWTGSAVSGTPGPLVEVSEAGTIAAPAIQIVGHRIRSTGGATSGGEGDQTFERDVLFVPNLLCASVEVEYSFVRPIKTSAQPPTSTTFDIDYDYDVTVDPGDTEVHSLEDGLGSVFGFLAQDNAGATIRDSNFFLTLTPYSATGGASGTGVAGAPVVIPVDQIGENDDVGVRVTTADDQDIPGMRLRTPSGAGVKSEWNASDGEIDLSLDALYVTESVDFGAMGSEGAQSAIGVTVTGAEVGDPVFACPAEEVTEAISVLAYVASADTVTLRAVNVTGSSVNPGATDWNIVVLKL